MTQPLFRRPSEADALVASLLGTFLCEAAEVYHLPTGDFDLHLLETGRLSEADYFVRLCERHAAAGNPRVDPTVARQQLFGRPLRACDEMVETVRRVRAAGYRTGLLTNTAREWQATWRQLVPLDELFDVVLDSSVVGLRKPDPAIYRLACQQLGVVPAECLFVDDLECNVAAARGLGMEALLCADSTATAAEVLRRLVDGGAVTGTPA